MTRFLLIPSVLAVGLLTTACIAGDKGDSGLDSGVEGDADADADADSDADADADSDADADANPYSNYTGSEALLYGFTTEAGTYNCDLIWDVSGGASSAWCDGCDWTFDLDMILDTENSYDDGTCGAGDTGYTYGYEADYYYGYGIIHIYSDYYGDWYPWAWATQEGDRVVYEYGYYVDYPYEYNGTQYYYSYQWYGYGDMN